MSMEEALKQAERMQQILKRATEEIERTTVVGSAAGRMVTVVADGRRRIRSIAIDRELIDPNDIQMLEILLADAIRQALDEVTNMKKEALSSVLGSHDIWWASALLR